MEGGVPGTLGTPLSLLETLWASINETSMKQGAHLMTPMTYLTLLFVCERHIHKGEEWIPENIKIPG